MKTKKRITKKTKYNLYCSLSINKDWKIEYWKVIMNANSEILKDYTDEQLERLLNIKHLRYVVQCEGQLIDMEGSEIIDFILMTELKNRPSYIRNKKLLSLGI